jgi:hypothetical protein
MTIRSVPLADAGWPDDKPDARFCKREIFLRTGIDTISENQVVGQISATRLAAY